MNTEAEDERMARVQIEQKLADRHVTVEQRKKMLAILGARPGTNVGVTWLASSPDRDSLGYAGEIADVFHDAHWNVTYPSLLTSYDRPVIGIMIETSEPELCAFVRRAFAAAEITSNCNLTAGNSSGAGVFVGSK